MDKIAPDGPVYQAGTLSGNPLAMAAGIAVLKKLKDKNAYSSLKMKAEKMQAGLSAVLDEFKGRVLYQSLESIFALFFTDIDLVSSVDQVRKCDMDLFAKFHAEMLGRGIYLSPSGYEVGFLSLAHSDGDIERTVSAVESSLRNVLK